MSIATLFDKEIVVMRLAPVSGYKKQYHSTATYEGAVEPLGLNNREGVPSVETNDFAIYVGVEADIKKGDQLTVKYKDTTGYVRKTERFLVKNLEYRVAGAGGGLVEHLEIQAERIQAK